MANIDDLGTTSITDMDTDEALELIRQIRLSRRVPVKSRKASKSKSTRNKPIPQVNTDQAAELLAILTGGN